MVEGVVVSVCGLVESIAVVDWAVVDGDGVAVVLGDVRLVRGWLDSVEVAAAARLAELAVVSPSLFPERVVADAGRVSLGEASKGFDRAKTTAAIPELGEMLQQGAASAGHVDVVTRVLRELNPRQRDRLVERGQALAVAASELPRDEFARLVRGEVRRISADDGVDRLAGQRRATSLRTWVDRESGMWCVRGEFDPETGVIALYLGRESRVANRQQRRALRVMYRGCAIPGCEARFADCDIHHLLWFRRLGLTDIDNLLPICHRHHHSVHEGGSHLALDTRRNLTITYPDGNIQTTGPPKTRSR